MGFSGGGGGVLTNHTHDTAVTNDGGALAPNATMFGLSNGSLLFSDGSNIQELGVGSDTQVLAISGSTPGWITNTANPLIKVSKTFADIDIGTTSMDIYTLPVDSALVNVWADITSVFDVSTAVTIGDSADPNGFQEATNWTSGTGLTSATRGAYVTSFKTMRSTSGTTPIKAYDFTTVSSGGGTFSQTDGGASRTFSNGGTREELAQQFNAGHVLIGEDINTSSWWIAHYNGSPTGNVQAFIRQADGTIRETSSTTLDASTVATETEYTFNFNGSTELAADDMITISLDNGTGGGSNSLSCVTNESGMTDGTLYQTTTTGSNYTEISGEQMKMTVGYGVVTTTTDTTGEIDFYLQVVN